MYPIQEKNYKTDWEMGRGFRSPKEQVVPHIKNVNVTRWRSVFTRIKMTLLSKEIRS